MCLDGDVYFDDDTSTDLDVARTNTAAVSYEVGGERGFSHAKNLDTNFFCSRSRRRGGEVTRRGGEATFSASKQPA